MAKYLLEGKIYSHADPRQHFSYSDGDEMENYILNFINQASDLSTGSEELAMGIRDWPTLYHLSPKRADLLRPLAETLREKTVLEIGCGCGAITRYLGELGCAVTALEGSERRAQITAARCRDLDNVHVVWDSFEDFFWDEKFDVITLIGVLEYSNLFMKGVSPPLEMLNRIKKSLRPDGMLIIAIENKIGLKYWAGAPEDHAGKAFFGIEDSYNAFTAITFGRTELKDLLSTAGYAHSEFLYPYPDYKLPDVILKENAFETENFELLNLLYEKFDYDQGQPHTTCFSAALAARSLLRNQLLPDFSNSFLVISRLSTPGMTKDRSTLAYTYTSGRKKCYCKENVFVASPTGSIDVIKHKLHSDAYPPNQPIRLQLINEQYFKGRLLSADLLDIVGREGWTIGDLSGWAGTYYEILKSYAITGSESQSLAGKYLDLTPFNILMDAADKAIIFDQEWSCEEEIPLYFIFFRGLAYSLNKIFSFAPPSEGTPDNLIELVIALINTIFPFNAAKRQECTRLEEKYFSQVPLLQSEVFACGKLKISTPIRLLQKLIIQKEEVIAEHKNEVALKNRKITALESELRQSEERQARFAAQLEDEQEELRRLSDTYRIRREALEKDVNWYRQTYENRSVQGVVKEKLYRGIKKQYRKMVNRFWLPE